MNRGEIRTLVAAIAEDANQTRYTAAKYNDAINKANQQFAMDSKALFKDSSITMVAGTAAYSLPTDFMHEKMVVLNGVELKPITRSELQRKKVSEDWTGDKGTPKWYIIDPEEAKKTIRLYPEPDSIDAGTALVLTYYAFPADLTSDTSTPLNGSTLMVQFHTGLASYAAWLMLMYLPQTPEIGAKRAELMGVYMGKVNEAIQTFGNTISAPWRFRVDDVRAR
jgi:hypothetical protein